MDSTKRRRARNPSPSIVYKKLGRNRARGQFISELNLIEIDSRLTGEEHLEVLIHEALHFLLPFLDEEAVEKTALNLSHILWEDGYRKDL